ncbi:MAG: cupin domain-containing protein [Nitrospinota bacterium]
MSDVRTIHPEDLPGYLGSGGRRTRVVLDPATGHEGLELYHVEIPPGGSSEFHSRPHPEVLIVLEGSASVNTKDAQYRAGAGTIVWIPAGLEHRHANAGEGTVKFLGIFAPPTGHADQVRTRPRAEE